MILKLAFIASCLSLAGCATSPDSRAVATCTDLISTSGGMLKYCQTGNRIEATESGLASEAGPEGVKLVDDPEVLQGLQTQAGLRPEFQASRKLVARACVADGIDYLSVSVKDLKRIIADRPVMTPKTAGDEAPSSDQSRSPS